MFSIGEFLCRLMVAFVLGVIVGVGAKSAGTESKVNKTCSGSAWVIEEPLIHKTITCVVEIKEKK